MAKRERIVSFDLIRLFSCLCVTIVHFNASVSAWSYGNFVYPNSITPNFFLENRIYLGNIGVSLFFMLSGATLMTTYKKGNLPQYFKKRFLNIFPMFWLAYAVATACDFLFNKGTNDGSLKWLFFSILGMDGYLANFGIVSFCFYKLGEWFLGCIIIIYLIFPLLHLGIEKHPCLTFSLSCILYALFIHGAKYLNYSPNGMEFFLRIPEILLGMLFVKYDLRNRPKLLLGISCSVAIIAVILRNQIYYMTLYISVCMAIFAILAVIGNYIKNVQIKHILEKVSGLTYPIFLVHHWLIDRMVVGFDLANMRKRDVLMLFIIYIVLSLLLAQILSTYANKIVAYIQKNLKQERTQVPQVHSN